MEQHLCTYRTPCSRGQGYFVLRYRRYSSPGWRPELPLSARPHHCAPQSGASLNHTNIAATTCDRESKKLMENTQPPDSNVHIPLCSATEPNPGARPLWSLSTPTEWWPGIKLGLLGLHWTACRAPGARLDSPCWPALTLQCQE